MNPELALARGLESLVGKAVVITLKPQNVFVWTGPPPPPGMRMTRGDALAVREIYTGVLVRLDKDILTLTPLPTAPKSFDAGAFGTFYYLSECGVSRDQMESITVRTAE